MKGYIHQFESFGCVDGPGSRFIVFTAGCNMRCKFCHNPDTWIMKEGKLWEPADVLKEALSCRSYWGKKGGITVSGGEPLLQIDFLIELFTLAKKEGVNTCIDTAGEPFTKEGEWFEKFKKLMEVTDILLMDIKHINEEEHIKLTGKTGKNIGAARGRFPFLRCVFIVYLAGRRYRARRSNNRTGETSCTPESALSQHLP